MLESQIDQAERKRVLDNDRRVKEQQQGSTFLEHTHSDAGGRFAQIGAAYVIGSKPDVASAYPAAATAHQIQLPNELPTGERIDEMIPVGPDTFQGQGPASAPTPGHVDAADAGPPHSLEQASSFTAQATGPRPARTAPPVDAASVGPFSFKRRKV
jgi:hypothetical protein